MLGIKKRKAAAWIWLSALTMIFLSAWFYIIFNQAIFGVGGVEALVNVSFGNSTFASSSVWNSMIYIKQIWAYMLVVVLILILMWSINSAQKRTI